MAAHNKAHTYRNRTIKPPEPAADIYRAVAKLEEAYPVVILRPMVILLVRLVRSLHVRYSGLSRSPLHTKITTLGVNPFIHKGSPLLLMNTNLGLLALRTQCVD